MTMKSSTAALVWSGLTLVALAPDAKAGPCRTMDGPFTSILDHGPACSTSPIWTCTHGRLGGDLDANYEFTFQALVPDAVQSGRLNYQGTSVITLSNGARMFGTDSGYFQLHSDGSGVFETTVSIQGGTSDYSDTSGRIVASGSFQQSGSAVGSYTGFICPSSAASGCNR